MKRRVLFVQGGGEGAHDDWDNRLVDSLSRHLGRRYDYLYPEMPDEASPRYAAWRDALVQAFETLDDGDLLVGHSIGGTVLINAVAERRPPFRPGAILLIAPPFIGAGGWPSDEIAPRRDLGAVLPAGVPIYLYSGSDDGTVPPEHVDLYARAIPGIVIRRLGGRDHQFNDDLSEVAADIAALG